MNPGSRSDVSLPPSGQIAVLRRERLRFLMTGAQTDGQLALVEVTAHQGFELPLHVHTREDEILHVMSGQLLVQLPDHEQRMGAGEVILLSRNVPHAVRLLTPHAHWLTAYTPAGYEQYLWEVSSPPELVNEELAGRRPADVPQLVAAGHRYGVRYFPRMELAAKDS